MTNETPPSTTPDGEKSALAAKTSSSIRQFQRTGKTLSREAAPGELENAQFAMAYFSRHGRPEGSGAKSWKITKGLAITWNEEGIWLDFSTDEGLSAMIHLDMIGPQGHPDSIVQKAINQWCTEFTEANKDA